MRGPELANYNNATYTWYWPTIIYLIPAEHCGSETMNVGLFTILGKDAGVLHRSSDWSSCCGWLIVETRCYIAFSLSSVWIISLTLFDLWIFGRLHGKFIELFDVFKLGPIELLSCDPTWWLLPINPGSVSSEQHNDQWLAIIMSPYITSRAVMTKLV